MAENQCYTVVYQDEFILVVNKGSGVLTIPAPGQKGPVLSQLLAPWHPCHRLDRDTSGLVVFAQGKARQKQVMEEFRLHRVEKTYLLVCCGELGKDQGWFRQDLDGRACSTGYRVLARQGGRSLVLVRLHSGRTNQIRRHFALAGYPLLGDFRFGRRRENPGTMTRTALHALSLVLAHPSGEGQLRLMAELPSDMAGLVESFGLPLPGQSPGTQPS